jgi:hypothetical protein
MIDLLGICKVQGIPQYKFTVGGNFLEVVKQNRTIQSSLNSRVFIRSKTEKDFIDRGLPVFASVLSNVSKRIKEQKIKYACPAGTSLMSLIDEIKKHLIPTEELFLDSKPDETEGNKPKEVTSNISEGLRKYRNFLGSIAQNFENLNLMTGSLLRTDIKKSMWGSKEVCSVLNGVRASTSKIAADAEGLDKHLERSFTATKYMVDCFNKPELQKNGQETASRLLEGFSNIKSYASELAQSLYRLKDIDRVCKASTGYPATFMMSSNLMDFIYEYDTLIDHIVKASVIEADTMEPLLVWKIRTTGALDVR